MSDIQRTLILEYDDGIPKKVAVKENDSLVEFFSLGESLVGSICVAKVTEYVKAYGACFAEIGEERRGYLSETKYRAGDWLLCQINGDAHDQKGVRLTDNVKISGAYIVLHGCAGIGISGKIHDSSDRERLQALGKTLQSVYPKSPFGIIFRTEAQFATEEVIREEFLSLVQRGQEILKKFAETRRNGIAKVIERPDELQKILFRYPPSTIETIYGDNSLGLHRIETLYPVYSGKTKLCKAPSMEKHNVSRKLATLMGRKVWLKSGGYLIFDKTEAMTVIDVNSGKMSGVHSPGELARRINFEAAAEIMRSLRLRSIGGMILCDMVDMVSEQDQEMLLVYMRKIAEIDPENTQIHDITQLGIVEITRKRTKNTEYLDKKG